MAETFTDKLKLSKRDTGDLNWGAGENANKDLIDKHLQLFVLRPPRTLLASLGSGAVGANLLGSTTYFYKITAFNAAGETTENQVPLVVEAQITEPSTPVPVILQWETVKGASGYRIYKSTVTGQEKFLAEVTGESTLTYTDTGNAATNGAISVPAQNTARASVSKIVAGANITINPPDGTGDVTVNASGGAAPADASITTKGVTKLSVAPVVATDPIAAGDNDSRMTNARTPTGSAGGDLGGTYPNPAVAKLQGTAVAATPPSSGQILKFDGTQWAPQAAPGGGSYATAVAAAPTGVAATDRAAIQSAIDALPAAGGRVVLREGTYVLDDVAINLKSNLLIVGQGQGTVLRLPNVGSLVKRVFSTATGELSGITIRDLSFDYSVSTGTQHPRIYGADFAVKGFGFEDIKFFGFNQAGASPVYQIFEAQGTEAEFINCVFDGNDRARFAFGGALLATKIVRLRGCRFSKPGGTVFRFIDTTDLSELKVVDCAIDVGNKSIIGIYMTCPGEVVGSKIQNIGGTSLAIEASSDLKATGNHCFYGATPDTLAPIQISGTNCVIVGNKANVTLAAGANGNVVAANKGTVTDNSGASNTIASSFVSGLRKLGEASPLAGDVKLEGGSNITLTQDAAANKISIAAAGGAWSKIVDMSFPEFWTTTGAISLTGLPQDWAFLRLIMELQQVGTTALTLRMYVNDKFTDTLYWSQRLLVDGAAVSADRVNSPRVADIAAGEDGFLEMIFGATGDLVHGQARLSVISVSGTRIAKIYQYDWLCTEQMAVFPVTDLQKLELRASAGQSAGNARLRVYKLV